MAEISSVRYVLMGADEVEGDWEFESFDEARRRAQALTTAGEPHAVIERTYSYADSALVWTPDGEGQWPPEEES